MQHGGKGVGFEKIKKGSRRLSSRTEQGQRKPSFTRGVGRSDRPCFCGSGLPTRKCCKR